MFRIAIAGLGDIAQKAYLPLTCQHPQIQPLFCSRNTQILATLAKQYRVDETYSDFGRMLDSRPDAVMLHSNTASHFALALAALEAGIPLFIDKPICDNQTQAEQLLQLARDKNLPLVVGFNRRFAPLYQPALSSQAHAFYYQKHRHRLSAAPRTLIFDDFIHLIDLLIVAAGLTAPTQISLQSHFTVDQQQLQRVRLQFCHHGRDFTAVMDRRAGANFERLEVFAQDQYWQVDNLRTGLYGATGTLSSIGFADWEPTLSQRGFNAMLDDWLQQLASGVANHQRLQQYQLSHQWAEQLVRQAELAITQTAIHTTFHRQL